MAQPSNTFSTYDSVGNREDLSDIIFDISPTETPGMTMAKKTKATATNHEWQTDALAAASATNAVIGIRAHIAPPTTLSSSSIPVNTT